MQIAAAIAENRGSVEDPQYVLSDEYIEAFVQYIAAVSELEAPVEDATAFAIERYGATLGESSNPNVAAYVGARIGGM